MKRQQRYFTNIEGNVTKTTDFVGNFVYENGLPAYKIYDEGRIVYNTDGTYFAEAFLKDHLGNVRVACRMLDMPTKLTTLCRFNLPTFCRCILTTPLLYS